MIDAVYEEKPLGLRDGSLRLMPYRLEWPDLYEEEVARITQATATMRLAVEIHHIGSTSVKGMAAKPILDIALVGEPENEQEIAKMLNTLGYIDRGERSGRHFILYSHGDVRTHNLHLYTPNDERLRKQIVFRDLLRRSPQARGEYEELKASLIDGARRDYAPGKTDFIAAVIADCS